MKGTGLPAHASRSAAKLGSLKHADVPATPAAGVAGIPGNGPAAVTPNPVALAM
jgi:hypothetical protein